MADRLNSVDSSDDDDDEDDDALSSLSVVVVVVGGLSVVVAISVNFRLFIIERLNDQFLIFLK
jgi:hypothetical protein